MWRCFPARAGLEEAVGVNEFRTKVKRRKALVEGELALSSEAQFLLVLRGVLATGSAQSLLFLPREICRAPGDG